MKTNSYKATVDFSEPEQAGSDVFVLRLNLGNDANFQASPGQFVVLEPVVKTSVMPRPFSIVRVESNMVTVLIKAIGVNTNIYSKLKAGDVVRVSGPQGSIIPLNPETKSYILVGGGIGNAALVQLAQELSKREEFFTIILGAKEKNQIAGLNFLRCSNANVITITEKGGERTGFVTNILADLLTTNGGVSTIIACGPKPMLKKVAEICKDTGNQCLVMLEEIMACGMGSCKGCAIFGVDGCVKHVCTDGPTFDAKWIDWSKLMPVVVTQAFERKPMSEKPMEINFCGLKLAYPSMNSSGCLAVDPLKNGDIDHSKLGALMTKGVTVYDRVGNQMPRICETPSGMINSIGLENIGLNKFKTHELHQWLLFGKPVFVNISGFSIDEYVTLARAINETDAVGIEVNISCPNIKHGGLTFGTDPAFAREVTQAVRKVTNKIVIVKLTPNVTDIVSIARAVVDAGADAVSLINTLLAMAIDPMTRKPKIGMTMGGLSGPAIRPVAVRMVHQLYQAKLGVPIVGMGGIEDAPSAAEFFIAGANMVAVGVGGFSKRQIFTDIDSGLMKILEYQGFSSISELTGSMITP